MRLLRFGVSNPQDLRDTSKVHQPIQIGDAQPCCHTWSMVGPADGVPGQHGERWVEAIRNGPPYERPTPGILVGPSAFREAVKTRHQAGTLVVVFLVTYKPISQVFGIPGVERAGRQVYDVIAEASPSDAIVGSLSWLSVGIFLPRTRDVDEGVIIRQLVDRVESDDLEIESGERAELRLAVGRARFDRGADAADVLQEAASLAESDEARFPDDWRYPVLIADD